jgi:hypothetical protein
MRRKLFGNRKRLRYFPLRGGLEQERGRDVRPNTYSRRKHLVVEVDAPDISGYCGGELVSFVALDLLIDLMSGLTEMVP